MLSYPNGPFDVLCYLIVLLSYHTREYNDLVEAKESLEKIIQRINADSRRMFAETPEIADPLNQFCRVRARAGRP